MVVDMEPPSLSEQSPAQSNVSHAIGKKPPHSITMDTKHYSTHTAQLVKLMLSVCCPTCKKPPVLCRTTFES